MFTPEFLRSKAQLGDRLRAGLAPRRGTPSSAVVLACAAVWCVGLGGCSAAAAVQTVKATAAVERARSAGAAADAPYELAVAEAYLAKAREESSEAQYMDAIRFARASRDSADKAVEVARTRDDAASAAPAAAPVEAPQ